MPIRLAILGSTGSIGRSALEVVRHYPDLFEVPEWGEGVGDVGGEKESAQVRVPDRFSYIGR